ncbi:MAG: acetyl-CoA decarbonylase/synthase complex subunit alpha [Euryarchaeota archaeon ADurb.Bin190]|nr:anaerobic carbon-monoxide dehydrogenase catalytic subunit [Methanothrix sp.]OQB27483.1 MAG: acetyl-CoA decarbonylase/synthase complex subunit alpha [Euryarchaeota archaeon ADurb.Bin190]HNQ54505.1 anaerobic carbon-monoxide dehydrogenase catalytic subunit [Methanothrix sp.]HNU40225.1 anaerobic carbon-monoxide dehydrogenase catalytic subunit [Methanothrix sp.]
MSKDVRERSIDPASQDMLDLCQRAGLETAWDRLEKQQPQCGFGELGLCCRNCNMGPCRIDPFGEGASKGVCGATADIIVARNLIRMIAAGAAAHSDHGRGVAHTFKLVSEGKAPSYQVKDQAKMERLMNEYGVDSQMALAEAIMAEFGRQEGPIRFTRRAPAKRVELWEKLGIDPRGIDREIVEIMHRTHIGVDNDPVHLILQGLRASIADGWGGSMIATELQDVLFGTPTPTFSEANLGVLEPNQVNIIVHGHEPLLSEMIVAAAAEPEMVDLAKKQGAVGINVAGMCCTGNEILMRHGVPVAGNFLQQELAVATGAVEAMVVDIQCIMPALGAMAGCFHTKFISTSPKAKFPGATHMEFHEETAMQTAKAIVQAAVLNYASRNQAKVHIPNVKTKCMVGFSVEAIVSALGGSLDPLLGAIKSGAIRGLGAVVGCNNPKIVHDWGHVNLVKELIKKDVLVVTTGCNALACAKAGLLLPEAADMAGEGLKGVCKALGVPPVLHMGSCVDISRILVAAAAIANALGVDISDLPAAGAAPEWMSEKAVSIGTYVVGSGVFTVLGTVPPVLGSSAVAELLTSGARDVVGAAFAVECDPFKAASLMIDHIESQRRKLGL